MNTKIPKVIYCEWVDAVSDAGWEKNDKSGEIHLCHAIGFLIKETKDFLCLATNIAENENSCRISIPKAWIRKKRYVKL